MYSLGNPVNRVDPDGRRSYLVARNGPANSSHMFIVTHARYVGDPKAQVRSWGETSKKKLGRVDKGKPSKRSKKTAANDKKAWEALGKSDAASKKKAAGVDFTLIRAKDGKVASVADAVKENKGYAAFGPNSNSAAQAVGDRAQGSPVETPEDFDPAVGADDSGQVEFDETQIAQDEAAGRHQQFVPITKRKGP